MSEEKMKPVYTIGQLKSAKDDLEHKITELKNQFENEYEVKIKEINIKEVTQRVPIQGKKVRSIPIDREIVKINIKI